MCIRWTNFSASFDFLGRNTVYIFLEFFRDTLIGYVMFLRNDSSSANFSKCGRSALVLVLLESTGLVQQLRLPWALVPISSLRWTVMYKPSKSKVQPSTLAVSPHARAIDRIRQHLPRSVRHSGFLSLPSPQLQILVKTALLVC